VCDSIIIVIQGVHGVPQNPEEFSNFRHKSEKASRNQVHAPPKELSVANGTSYSPLPRKDMRMEGHNPESKSRLRRTGWTCKECSQWIPDRETYVSHMKRSHGRVRTQMKHFNWVTRYFCQKSLKIVSIWGKKKLRICLPAH